MAIFRPWGLCGWRYPRRQPYCSVELKRRICWKTKALSQWSSVLCRCRRRFYFGSGITAQYAYLLTYLLAYLFTNLCAFRPDS